MGQGDERVHRPVASTCPFAAFQPLRAVLVSAPSYSADDRHVKRILTGQRSARPAEYTGRHASLLSRGSSWSRAFSPSIALAGPQADAQQPPTGAALADLLAKFDAYAESSRQRWGVPGMAIAVIQGKTMVFSKGYGARVQGEPAAVDPSTVFQIGSISKSFTATVMGSLVDEGKVAFEDHVIDRYPGFQMYDPWVTREFMIWDLMAQHSGMAPYAGDSAVTIGFTRQDFVNGLRHLKPVSSFRSEFAYVNNLWLAVAALQETLTGRKWEDLVAERVFTPLGMTSATTTVDGLLKGANVALPHVLVDGVPTPTRADFWDIDAVYTFGPGGRHQCQRARHGQLRHRAPEPGRVPRQDHPQAGDGPMAARSEDHHHREGPGERPARGPRAGAGVLLPGLAPTAPLADSVGLAQWRHHRLEGRRRVHAGRRSGPGGPEQSRRHRPAGSADVLPVRPLPRAAREGLYRRVPRRCQGPGRGRQVPGPPGEARSGTGPDGATPEPTATRTTGRSRRTCRTAASC